MEANAVFSGGGVKGIAFVGALQVCEDLGYKWRKLAGTSSGAIIASLLAAGYTAKELKALMYEIDYKKIVEKTFLDYIPFGRPMRLLFRNGLYSGNYIERWLEEKLAQKNVHTFSDLPKDKLHIIASNISKGTILQLPKDAAEIGEDAQHLKVSRAVRMSISIPLFFDPIKIKMQRPQYIVDGGVISNFPVWIFDDDRPEKYPTFGFNLRSQKPEHDYKVNNPFSMLASIFAIMLETQDMKYIEHQDAVRTIFIKTEGVKVTDFSLSEEKKKELYEAGVQAAKKFFSVWNFDDYVRTYVRKTKRPSRVV